MNSEVPSKRIPIDPPRGRAAAPHADYATYNVNTHFQVCFIEPEGSWKSFKVSAESLTRPGVASTAARTSRR